MAYHLNKYGEQVKDDLDAVENKSIYPDASKVEKGLMTEEHVQKLDDLQQEIDENTECLTAYEIMMICR